MLETGIACLLDMLARIVMALAPARNQYVEVSRMAGPSQAVACSEGVRAGPNGPASKPAPQERSRMALKGKASKVHRRRWHPHPVSSLGAPLAGNLRFPPVIVVDTQVKNTRPGERAEATAWGTAGICPLLDFTHFKRHKRGNLQYDGTEWRGVSVHRSWRSIVKNPPTPTTSGYAQR